MVACANMISALKKKNKLFASALCLGVFLQESCFWVVEVKWSMEPNEELKEGEGRAPSVRILPNWSLQIISVKWVTTDLADLGIRALLGISAGHAVLCRLRGYFRQSWQPSSGGSKLKLGQNWIRIAKQDFWAFQQVLLSVSFLPP